MKTFYMSQMNPKKILHSTTFSVQLPYIAGHSSHSLQFLDPARSRVMNLKFKFILKTLLNIVILGLK